MKKSGYVYILTNERNRVLYVGVTSQLPKRIWEHKNKYMKGFTQKYNCTKLAYYEDCGDIESAIQREKQIKGGSRQKKINLIETLNPSWTDLNSQIRG